MNDILDFFLQHWQLSALFVVAVGAYLVYEFMLGEDRDAVTPEQAVGLINHQHGVVIDVRTPEEFSTGHILHAINVDSKEPDTKFKTLNKYAHKPIILVCAHGRRSAQCMLRLKNLGFAQVHSLAGGLESWKDAGLPLTK
ncbi:MAG TPA: rhodanese-like domain-containing protein [Gammaproteobacteria bacterium]|nr:rhodanese-like domain-containing protein [Gammaproteobacteria bacterium]